MTAIGAVTSPQVAVLDQPVDALCYPTSSSVAVPTSVAVTSLAEQRVRIDIGATTDLLIAVIGADPYRITLRERCPTAR